MRPDLKTKVNFVVNKELDKLDPDQSQTEYLYTVIDALTHLVDTDVIVDFKGITIVEEVDDDGDIDWFVDCWIQFKEESRLQWEKESYYVGGVYGQADDLVSAYDRAMGIL